MASDSGAYDNWGGAHHMGYSMQTIASNSILIYNSKKDVSPNESYDNMIYSGGQNIHNGVTQPSTLEELLNNTHGRLNQCTSLGVANVELDGKYLYSYMGGDMTKAYDLADNDEVTRYMFAVATGDPDRPLAFLTFDRVTVNGSGLTSIQSNYYKNYTKTALIHIQEAPTITDDGFAIITNTKNGNSGKMIVQTVGDATTITAVGGEGNEFNVNGTNIAPEGKPVGEGSPAEYGWGRIEISPATKAKTNHILTVMYVTDAANGAAPIAASDITSDNLAGAEIFGKAVMFPKNEKLLTQVSEFTLSGASECYITGVSAGTWNIMNGDTVVETVTVAEGTNMLTFTASTPGTYKLTPAN